jgi:hypothetical protein
VLSIFRNWQWAIGHGPLAIAGLCLWLLTPDPWLLAQEVKLPAEIKAGPGEWIVVAPLEVDGGKPKWRIDPGLQEVPLNRLLPPEMVAQLKGKVLRGDPGRYKVEAWNAKGDEASEIATCWISIGSPQPPPVVPPDNVVVPPGPTPGPREVTIVRETRDSTAATFAMIRDLRLGPHAQYLQQHGLTPRILDDDREDASGAPSPDVEALRPYLRDLELPALIVRARGQVVLRQSLKGATAAAVVEALKALDAPRGHLDSLLREK